MDGAEESSKAFGLNHSDGEKGSSIFAPSEEKLYRPSVEMPDSTIQKGGGEN